MGNASFPKHPGDFGRPGNGPLLLAYAANFVFVQGYSRFDINGQNMIPIRTFIYHFWLPLIAVHAFCQNASFPRPPCR